MLLQCPALKGKVSTSEAETKVIRRVFDNLLLKRISAHCTPSVKWLHPLAFTGMHSGARPRQIEFLDRDRRHALPSSDMSSVDCWHQLQLVVGKLGQGRTCQLLGFESQSDGCRLEVKLVPTSEPHRMIAQAGEQVDHIMLDKD